jgi:hypothetical protein
MMSLPTRSAPPTTVTAKAGAAVYAFPRPAGIYPEPDWKSEHFPFLPLQTNESLAPAAA